MKFSNILAFATLAFCAGATANENADANTDGTPAEAVVDAVFEIIVASKLEDKAMVQNDVVEVVEEEVGPDVGEAITAGEGEIVPADRKLAIVQLVETTHEVQILNSAGELVTISWNSVDYIERYVPCNNYQPLGTGTCFQVYMQYRAIVIPNNGVHVDNVDQLSLHHIDPQWKASARALLKTHVEDHYEGKVFTQVRVDDHIHISTFGDPHFKTFSGHWFGTSGDDWR